MSWANEPIWGLDFESTGVDPLTARTVTVALVEMDGTGALTRCRSAVVDSGVDIPDEAAAIHGYSTERVREEGLSPAAVFPKILDALHEAHDAGIPLAIFNGKYDWPLLHAELDRHMLPAPPKLNLLDPFVMDRYLDKYRKGSRKLVDVAKHYDVPLLDAHTASADAYAACGVARAIGRTYPAAGSLSLEELHSAQALWFEAWKDGMNQYLAKKAGPNGEFDPVVGGWPL